MKVSPSGISARARSTHPMIIEANETSLGERNFDVLNAG
jgi:hypothetical protein